MADQVSKLGFTSPRRRHLLVASLLSPRCPSRRAITTSKAPASQWLIVATTNHRWAIYAAMMVTISIPNTSVIAPALNHPQGLRPKVQSGLAVWPSG